MKFDSITNRNLIVIRGALIQAVSVPLTHLVSLSHRVSITAVLARTETGVRT